MRPQLADLKGQLAALERPILEGEGAQTKISLGVAPLDGALEGGLDRARLHDVYAAHHADSVAVSGFVAGLVQRVACQSQPIAWLRHAGGDHEAGKLYAPGLMAMGLHPNRVLMVRSRKSEDLLQAALQAARCPALGAVVLDLWGPCPKLDLTATRRLALAAERAGVTVFVARAATDAQPSVAMTRWQVRSARSQALAANAPGHPCFDLTLQRNKAGASGQNWRVEWHHDRQQFQSIKPLSGAVVPLPASQPFGQTEAGFAGRTGYVGRPKFAKTG